MTNLAVSCGNLSKSYEAGGSKVYALSGVELAIAAGEMHMIVGPSGCGKTTLISIIAGILAQDSGTCTVLGNNLQTMGERARAKFRGTSVGFVFQAFNLIPTLSVVENVAVPLVINGMSLSEGCGVARKLLARVGLEARADERPNKLSGGQQQRVAIARALVHKPRIVVCDEPTSALDHENGMKILGLFRELAREEGITLVVVTHDARIFSFADHVSRMDDGKVVEVLTGAQAAKLYH